MRKANDLKEDEIYLMNEKAKSHEPQTQEIEDEEEEYEAPVMQATFKTPQIQFEKQEDGSALLWIEAENQQDNTEMTWYRNNELVENTEFSLYQNDKSESVVGLV